MKKEKYNNEKEQITARIKMLNTQLSEIREKYLQANKPCELDSNVIITKHNGRTVKGLAKSFSIDSEQDVYVSAIKPEKGVNVYLSVNYKSIQVV